MADPIELKFLGSGGWMNVGSLLALGLTGYESPLPDGSTVSVSAGHPGSMCLAGPQLVADGVYDIAISAPGWLVAMAVAGKGRFSAPLSLRSLAAFPHDDRLAFAVRRESGITSLADVRERQLPLKVSTYPHDFIHPAGYVIDEIFAMYGFSQEDIVSWGGEIRRDRPRNPNSTVEEPVSPDFDLVVDEAIMTRRWERISESYDLRFLPLDDEVLERCAAMAMTPGKLEKGRLRGLDEDVATIDFSGWGMYCSEAMPDELGYAVAQALDRQKDAITARFDPASGHSPLTSAIDMERVAQDVTVPLHPGAAAYYREMGYAK